MNAPIEFASDRRLQSVAAEAGYYELPEALREGLKDMLVGAIEAIKSSIETAENSEWWCSQTRTVEEHLRYANNYCADAYCAMSDNHVSCPSLHTDSVDGIENWKHTAARLGFACCVRRLAAEESEGSK